jgi:hypothetical protein
MSMKVMMHFHINTVESSRNMTSKFPKIIIGGDSLKENLNKIHNQLKNKNTGGLILQSASRDNNLKLCLTFLHLLYNESEWKEGRFKLSNDNKNSQFTVTLSKKQIE